jgi:hypothetical protein
MPCPKQTAALLTIHTCPVQIGRGHVTDPAVKPPQSVVIGGQIEPGDLAVFVLVQCNTESLLLVET